MKIKFIYFTVFVSTIVYTPLTFAVTIGGWGVAGNNLFQLSFDSNSGTTAATRSLFTTLPDSSVSSMALSPDGNSLFAISSAGNNVYKVDLNTATTTTIGQVPTAFDLSGASTRGNEILMLNNGVLPVAWSLDMDDAANSSVAFSTTETTSIGGRASSMVCVDNDTMLFFTDHHNNSSFIRRAWTMENDGTTTLLGTTVDPLNANALVLNFNASDMAADGKVYGLTGGRQVWEIDFLGAHDGIVEATLVDTFTPDGVGHGWSTVVFEPAAIVPVPASVWLFGSGLIGLIGVARRKIDA